MANISNYLEELLLNVVFNKGSYTGSDVYLALYVTDPTEADVGIEVSGGGYTRQVVSFTSASQGDNGACVTNSSDVEYPAATSDWGTVTHVGVRDSLTEGNLLYYGLLSVPKTITTGDVLKILVGNLALSLD